MDNKKSTIEWVENFTEACETVTDELTRSAGMIVTKITPLLAPLASGFCTFFAFYDGGGRMLARVAAYPYFWSFVVGAFLFVVIEGINFAATFTRDRGDKHKATHAEVAALKLDRMVLYCFLLTLASVAMLETLPGLVAWRYGEISAGDLGFRVGILILPFFSKMGASIFSASIVLDEIEGTVASRKQRRLQERKAAAELEIELEEKRKESAQRVAIQEAEAKQRLELERLKVEAKLNGKRSESVQKSVQIIDPNSVEHDPNTELDSEPNTKLDSPLAKVNAGRKAQKELGKVKMLQIYSVRPDASLRDVGDELGKSPSTVSEWLKELESEKRIVLNGQVHVNHEYGQ